MSILTTPTYRVLDAATVPEYIAAHPRLSQVVDAGTLSVREVGDGNLNLVFVCRDAAGRGICLKQSLPYVRLVGESWPLTPHRATAEARSFDAAVMAAPGFVPDYYGFDQENFVLAMENLDEWVVWRTALNEGGIHRGVAAQMGEYVARMAFATSLFGLTNEEMHLRAAAAVNPDLCRITEDLVFTEPYIDHEHNSYVPEVVPEVMAIRGNIRHLAEVGTLKYRFMTCGQALIHGDLHTGSVMVTRGPAGETRGKAFDAEFCYYGPVGFDLGALIGNYLFALARGHVLGRPSEFMHWVAGLGNETWTAFERHVRQRWPERVDSFYSDEFLQDWLEDVWRDTIGYAGCKAIRRIVGLAKVSDIETLPSAEHVAAATAVLRTASRWIVERAHLDSPAALAAVAQQVIEEVTV
jgi:5-methylthioribose kinase